MQWEDALALVGLPYKDKKLFAQYSMGMKQRLAIALAVMHDPELLILDEPINGLDPIGIAEMRRFIRQLCDERGKTILLSSHILSEVAQLADDIGIIDNGALLEEESLQALEEKNGRYIRLGVSDAARAAQMLETEFGTDRFMVENDRSLPHFRFVAAAAAAGGRRTEKRPGADRAAPVRGYAGRLFQTRDRGRRHCLN